MGIRWELTLLTKLCRTFFCACLWSVVLCLFNCNFFKFLLFITIFIASFNRRSLMFILSIFWITYYCLNIKLKLVIWIITLYFLLMGIQHLNFLSPIHTWSIWAIWNLNFFDCVILVNYFFSVWAFWIFTLHLCNTIFANLNNYFQPLTNI